MNRRWPRTLGKVDELGNVAEDLRAQILGQLSERLNYDPLGSKTVLIPLKLPTRMAAVGTEVGLSTSLRSSHLAAAGIDGGSI